MRTPAPLHPPLGYTLVELLTVVTLVGILSAAAVPSLRGSIDQIRVQSLVRRLTGDLHLARMLAVREGRSVDLLLTSSGDGCVSAYRIARRGIPADPLVRPVGRESPGVCLIHNGRPRLTFDPRGMARTGGKRFTVRAGEASDSVVVSFAGRIRTGRRRRRSGLPATFSRSATISRLGNGCRRRKPW